VISQRRPVYPFELRRAGVTGEAFVDFFVKTDSTVANAVAIRATDIRFGAAAVDAVRAWLFVPGRANGRLVVTHIQVPMIFTITEE
jgi:protein TonB